MVYLTDCIINLEAKTEILTDVFAFLLGSNLTNLPDDYSLAPSQKIMALNIVGQMLRKVGVSIDFSIVGFFEYQIFLCTVFFDLLGTIIFWVRRSGKSVVLVSLACACWCCFQLSNYLCEQCGRFKCKVCPSAVDTVNKKAVAQ